MFSKLWIAAAIAAPIVALLGADLSSQKDGLVVHEWGTLTSVADTNGEAMTWASLNGPADLPCFVATLGKGVQGSFKFIPGLVRMETPVVYFYSPRRTTLPSHVGIPNG